MTYEATYEDPFVLGGIVRMGRETDAQLHDFPPEITAKLTDFQLYTTETPRDPGTFKNYRQDLGRGRAMAQIADNVTESLRDVPSFESAVMHGVVGSRLTEVFSAVTALHAHNVHVLDLYSPHWWQRGRHIGEQVVAEHMAFVVQTDEQAISLGGALQALLCTPKKARHMVYTLHHNKSPVVIATNMHEDVVRSLSRAAQAVAEREYAQRGVVLPKEKRSLDRWKEGGETFSPDVETALKDANDAYRLMLKDASYAAPESALARLEIRDLIGTDPAGVLQAMRDLLNRQIHMLRRNTNPEQNPSRDERPCIETGIELRRDPVSIESIHYGPPSSRGLTTGEQIKVQIQEALEDARHDPVRALGEVLNIALGGVVDISVKLVLFAPYVVRWINRRYRDYQSWREQKHAAATAGKKLDSVKRHLYATGILAEEQPTASEAIPPYPTREL
jgi:hypothetical protein